MVTDTRLMPQDVVHSELDDWTAQWFCKAMRRVGQTCCGIRGHNVLLRYEPSRLLLQCTTCGYESPGWELRPACASSYSGDSFPAPVASAILAD